LLIGVKGTVVTSDGIDADDYEPVVTSSIERPGRERLVLVGALFGPLFLGIGLGSIVGVVIDLLLPWQGGSFGAIQAAAMIVLAMGFLGGICGLVAGLIICLRLTR
jgi:hypothetical protein